MLLGDVTITVCWWGEQVFSCLGIEGCRGKFIFFCLGIEGYEGKLVFFCLGIEGCGRTLIHFCLGIKGCEGKLVLSCLGIEGCGKKLACFCLGIEGYEGKLVFFCLGIEECGGKSIFFCLGIEGREGKLVFFSFGDRGLWGEIGLFVPPNLAIQATRTKKWCLNQVWEPPKHDFKPFGAPFGSLLDALGRISDASGTLLAVVLASLGPLKRFLKHLKRIWERFGSYMRLIWDPFARFLHHILIKEPPRCLASRRGASQYAGVPNPMSVLDLQTSGVRRSFCCNQLFGHGLLLLQLNSNSR